MYPDPFDEILGLEEQFYDEGYQQGMADGVKVGRIEARTMGLVNGFEKYVESARLHGKSLIWANRLPKPQKTTSNSVDKKDEPSTSDSTPKISVDKPVALALPPLSDNARLAKHIKVIYALAESDSLSTDNSDEAVSDFDDRLKRAQAKAKIIERMAGEADLAGSAKGGSIKDGGIEDALNARH